MVCMTVVSTYLKQYQNFALSNHIFSFDTSPFHHHYLLTWSAFYL